MRGDLESVAFLAPRLRVRSFHLPALLEHPRLDLRLLRVGALPFSLTNQGGGFIFGASHEAGYGRIIFVCIGRSGLSRDLSLRY